MAMQQMAAPSTKSRQATIGEAVRGFLTYSPSKINPQVSILFLRQLSSFVRVGVPVTTAIEMFAEQATNVRLREAYGAVAADIQRGVRLSDAFAARPKVFPRIVADMVRSAEVTGNLDVVLKQAARHIEREASARNKIRAAMMYPLVIMTFALLVTIGIVLFVLPEFRNLYASLGVQTPGILNAMLGISGAIRDHVLIIALLILLTVLGLGIGLRTDRGRYFVDATLLKVPFISTLIKTSMTERFCRTLGDMLAAGVPISQTYAVVIENIRNRVYQETLRDVGPALAAGQGMYRPLQLSGVFAPAVIQMFRVGEETGHLDSNLLEAAEMYEEELDYRIKRLTAFLEPAMIVFVGVVVGFVAITLITSIYSLAGGFK
jgi:type IV pilus assembly protein PilC